MSTMTFPFFIRVNAGKHPDRPALLCEDRICSYRELHDRTNRLANALRNMGIRKGDRVSLYMSNCPEYIELIFALAKIAAVFVPISYRLLPGEMKHIVDHSESVALFFTEDLQEQVTAVHRDLATVPQDRCILVGPSRSGLSGYEEILRSGSPEDPEVDVREDDDLYVGYTSGTTGFPKGAIFTHKARMINLLQMAIEFGISQEDSTLVCGPLYHGAPCFIGILHLFLGGQVVLMKQFHPVEALRHIQAHRITTAFMVPTMYNMILNLPPEERDAWDVRSVRALVSAAAPLPTQIKENILRFFPGAGLHELYGFTEGGIVTNLRPEDQLRKTRCVGRPMVLMDMKILDDDGHELPPGKEGLVYVKGPCFLKEYLKNPEATQAAFRGDWITGQDIGRIDEEGYLYLVDRKADMVISGGVNVYPLEIEEILHRHPKVLEAAVIGVPDSKWGEALLAFVVPKPGSSVDPEEIVSFCEGKMARFKIPRSIQLVAELPKSPAGKVLKRVLREPFWTGREARI